MTDETKVEKWKIERAYHQVLALYPIQEVGVLESQIKEHLSKYPAMLIKQNVLDENTLVCRLAGPFLNDEDKRKALGKDLLEQIANYYFDKGPKKKD
jgi:endoglucanase Acf2